MATLTCMWESHGMVQALDYTVLLYRHLQLLLDHAAFAPDRRIPPPEPRRSAPRHRSLLEGKRPRIIPAATRAAP